MNIVVDHVTKTIHRAVVLQDISLNFESGKVYGLQGENGSGKTMLLRLMCGLIYATEGSVSVNDRRLGKDLDFPESVGVMIESPAFIDEYTGQKNLELLAGLKQLISVSDIHNTFFVVYLHHNLVIRADYNFHQEVIFIFQPLIYNLTNSFFFYHRLTIKNKKEELNRPSTFHPFRVQRYK